MNTVMRKTIVAAAAAAVALVAAPPAARAAAASSTALLRRDVVIVPFTDSETGRTPTATDIQTARAATAEAIVFWARATGGKISLTLEAVAQTRVANTRKWDQMLARVNSADPTKIFIFLHSDETKLTSALPPQRAPWTDLSTPVWSLATTAGAVDMAAPAFRRARASSALAHEIGHTFGLYHTNSLKAGVNGDLGTRWQKFGDSTEYGDNCDVMGGMSCNGRLFASAATLDALRVLPLGSRLVTLPRPGRSVVMDIGDGRGVQFSGAGGGDTMWVQQRPDGFGTVVASRVQRWQELDAAGVLVWHEGVYSYTDGDLTPELRPGKSYTFGKYRISVIGTKLHVASN